jgi:C-terminal processing protease CtpA/Prc
MWPMRRAAFGIAVVLVAVCAYAPVQQLTPEQYVQDFDVVWQRLYEEYAYFDYKLVDWKKARDIYRPKAQQAKSMGEFVAVMEALLDQLCDFHTHLNTNTGSSQRLAPSGARLWAEWRRGRVFVTEVRGKMAPKPGDQITAIEGVPVLQAIERRIGPAANRQKQEVKQFALTALLAGKRDKDVYVTVRGKSVLVAPKDVPTRREEAVPIESRLLADNVGYIRFNNSLGYDSTIKAFDNDLVRLRRTDGLILDLRDTPGGGNTVVARGIMGRLVKKETGYQKHIDPGEQRATGVRRSWIEMVSPRGSFVYAKPVVVLVNRWTASMGEGIAIGLAGMGRAKVVGTRMAGLLGAKRTVEMPNSRFAVSYAAEKLASVDGTPRERFVPDVVVDLAKASGPDPILAAGLKALRR